MGFYGNITNTSKTQFSFDKRYSNRYTMDLQSGIDGVYVGRYVLVEYDEDPTLATSYPKVYRDAEKLFYTTITGDQATRIKKNEGISTGDIVIVPGATATSKSYNIDEPTMELTEFWQCTGENKDGYLVFSLITTSDEVAYHQNYVIDAAHYGKGRGYDSTVWQKTYVGNEETYVMVAELNTIVPTFDLTADAPTLTPLTPHFDTDSNNVYYKLHWQPQWGLRVKSSDNRLQMDSTTIEGDSAAGYTVASTDMRSFPSDETSSWTKTVYDKETGIVSTKYFNYPENEDEGAARVTGSWVANKESAHDVPAAIYYNKAGFDPSRVSYSDDAEYKGWEDNYNHVKDEISLTPTGQSGIKYPLHDGTLTKDYQPDIQELTVMLPSLGDSVAKMWDIVYGDRETNKEYNEQIGQEKDSRDMTIEWEPANAVLEKHGHRLVKRQGNGRYTFSKDQVSTLAGAINSVHDIMGMIIAGGTDSSGNETIIWETDEEKLQTQIDKLNEEYIYYKDGRFYRKHKTFDFTPVDSSEAASIVNLQNWDERTEKLYFIDSDKTSKPGYILDNTYHPEMTYVKNLDLSQKVTLGGEYKANTYYCLETNTNEGFNNSYYKIRLCTDSEYDDNKDYYIIKSSEMLTYKPVYFYSSNKYYYDDNGTYKKDTSTTVSANRKYYLDGAGKTPVSFSDYKIKKYYTANGTESYVLSTASTFDVSLQYYQKYVPYYPGRYYYAVYSPKKLSLAEFESGSYFDATELKGGIVVDGIPTSADQQYDPNKDYYSRDFIKDNNITPSDKIYHYYTVKTKPGANDGSLGYYIENRNYDEINLSESTYKPGVYYHKQEDGTFVLDNDGFDGEGTTYYKLTITYEQVTTNDIIDVDSAEEVYLMDFPGYTESNTITSGYFYKETDPKVTSGSNRYMWVELNASNVDSLSYDTMYYRLTTEKLKDVYAKNTYYYQYVVEGNADGEEHSGSYLIDAGDFNIKKTYYENITGTEVTTLFYHPNKYYYKDDNGNYILATNESYGLDNFGNQLNPIVYYNKKELYVIEDNLNIYKTGALWSSSADTIPESVQLGTKEERWELQELKDFAYSLNTIHGLMLKIHEMLEMGDTLTRDENTLMGAINLLNDKISKFGEMKPGNTLIVDDYGRITSATLSTAQAFKTTNWQTSIGEGNNKNSSENRFISKRVNTDPINPKLTFNHIITTVSDTTTTSNKNSKTTTGIVGNNDGQGDTLKLLTPIVDNMGHVVGKNTETVTLPYGFKTVQTQNSSSVVTALDTSAGASSAATSTQDTLTLKGGNKWITTNMVNKVASFGHLLSPLAAQAHQGNGGNNLSLSFGGSFNIPTFTSDEAGHIVAVGSEKITLPSPSLVDSATGNIVVGIGLNETQGSLTISKNNLANVLLSGLDTAETSQEALSAGDKLGVGLMKLQNQVSSLKLSTENNFESLIVEDVAKIGQYVTKVNQKDGKIEVTRTPLLVESEVEESKIVTNIKINEEGSLELEKNEYIPLPTVTADDAGKILRVSTEGLWAAESLPQAEEGAF